MINNHNSYGTPKCHNNLNHNSSNKSDCSDDSNNSDLSRCNVPIFYPKIPTQQYCPIKSLCDPNLKNNCHNKRLPCNNLPQRSVTTWKVNYLVSNQANQAANIDSSLVNPWGIVIYNNTIWNINGGTDSLTNYDLFGNKLLGTVYVRDPDNKSSYPTGIAINCGGGFLDTSTTTYNTQATTFAIATEHSTVHVFNPAVNVGGNSPVVINKKITGNVCVYRGIALNEDIMYLADLFQNKIDVFDSSYNSLSGYIFIDNELSIPISSEYGPNNIVRIGNYLYVAYARKNPNNPLQSVSGPGYGFISIFNFDGTFVKRFTSKGVLNNPWAIIPAPCECGFPPNSILVGNHGDGRINIFDCEGRLVGPLLNQSGLPLVIDGLRGLAPHYTHFNEIYFTSSINDLSQGLLGSITKSQVLLI